MFLKIDNLLGVYVGFRVVTLSAASDAPNMTKAYSGMLGRITATTSSLCAPRLTRPWPKDLDKAWASDIVYLSPLTASTWRHCIWLDRCNLNRNSQLPEQPFLPTCPLGSNTFHGNSGLEVVGPSPHYPQSCFVGCWKRIASLSVDMTSSKFLPQIASLFGLGYS